VGCTTCADSEGLLSTSRPFSNRLAGVTVEKAQLSFAGEVTAAGAEGCVIVGVGRSCSGELVFLCSERGRVDYMHVRTGGGRHEGSKEKAFRKDHACCLVETSVNGFTKMINE